jgi:hypothetical protein
MYANRMLEVMTIKMPRLNMMVAVILDRNGTLSRTTAGIGRAMMINS